MTGDRIRLSANTAERQRLTSIVLQKIESFSTPSVFGVAIFGSIAEGFGNELSDIDVLVVDPNEGTYPVLRQPCAHQEQRMEFFFRSATSLASLAKRVNRYDKHATEPPPNAEDLDAYQRICCCVALSGQSIVSAATNDYSQDTIARVKSKMAVEKVDRLVSEVWLMLDVGLPGPATNLAREAVRESAAFWAAQHDETYYSKKFLFAQLRRAGMEPELLRDVTLLLREERDCVDAPTYCTQCLNLAARLVGRDLVRFSDARCTAIGHPQLVHVWDRVAISTGSTLHVVPTTAQKAAELLSDAHFAVSLSEQDEELRRLVGQLYKAGLVQLVVTPDHYRFARQSPPPAANLPTIVWNGIATDPKLTERASSLVCIPLSMRRLIGAGNSLVNLGWTISTRHEDAIGAMRANRWDEVEYAFRRLIKTWCACALSSIGVHPLPRDEWLLEDLRDYELNELYEQAMRALALPVTGLEDIAPAYAAIQRLAQCLPSEVVGEILPHIGDALINMYQLIIVLGTWGALAQLHDVPVYAVPDVQDLIRAQRDGAQVLLMDPDAIEELLKWTRSATIESELETLRAQSEIE